MDRPVTVGGTVVVVRPVTVDGLVAVDRPVAVDGTIAVDGLVILGRPVNLGRIVGALFVVVALSWFYGQHLQ